MEEVVLKRFGEHRQRFDIRERDIVPVVDAARVLALETRFFGSIFLSGSCPSLWFRQSR